MPVSRPGAFGDRKEDPECPFTNQGRSPRSTADTCPSKAITPNQIGLSSLPVRDRIKNSPILSQKAKAKLVASFLNSSSVTEPGELLRRSDQAFQSKRGG